MADAKTEYLGLIVFPDITGVYQRDLRIALVTGKNGNDSNMHIIDTAIKKLADALKGLSKVASSGSYNDLSDTPEIPSQIPIASVEVAGIVKPDGETILVDKEGKISAAVKVAIATLQAAGLVKPDGVTITVDEDGTISATVGIATTDTAGTVKPDGKTILLGEDGLIEAATATNKKPGIVKPDGESVTVDKDGTIHAKVKDAYTKAEVDQMLSDLSGLLMSADDLSAIYAAVNTVMGETTAFSGLGGSILAVNALADELVK